MQKFSRAFGMFAVGVGAFACANHALSQSSPVSAAGRVQAAVTGVVRDTSGSPQVGALVELLGPNFGVVAQTFTDDRGRYALPRVHPGTYQVKVSGSIFLPTLRENLHLLADSRLVVNLTLNTLYEAVQWLPAQPRQADEPKDDWSWTLRLSTNRPLLRILEDGSGSSPVVLVSDGTQGGADRDKRVTVRSGSNRFGEGGMRQDIEVEHSNDDAHQLILRTALTESGSGNSAAMGGYQGSSDSSATIRSTAAYRQQFSPGHSLVSVASFTAAPDIAGGGQQGLQSMTVRSAAIFDMMDAVHLEVGNELEAIHLGQTLTASHPFANLRVVDGSTTIRYQYATSPNAEQVSELDRDGTLAPRVTERHGALHLEDGQHHSLTVEHRSGRVTTQLGYFHDSLAHPLVGGGVAFAHGGPALSDADAVGGNLLYDPASDLITVSGRGYSSRGLVATAREQLTPESWIALRYAAGQSMVMSVSPAGSQLATLDQALGDLVSRSSQMVDAAFGSTLAHTGTEWRASYRWQPSDNLTQIDPFDSSIPEAYLSFYFRQPIHNRRLGPHQLQAILDVRNLLAQGYRPFLSQDGSTLYFAQAERSVEGGLSFSF